MTKIRRMEKRDLERVYELGSREERFRVGAEETGFWTREQLFNWVGSENDVLLVAENEGRIVGYALSQYHAPTRKATFENLHVDLSYRKSGIGKLLTAELVRSLKEKGAYICTLVEPDNEAIIKVLEENGFRKGKQTMWMDQST